MTRRSHDFDWPKQHRKRMPRTNDEMNKIAIALGEAMSDEIDGWDGIGAVLVVYELDGAERRLPDSPIAFTATRYEHVQAVLAQVMELVRKIPILRGDRN